MVFAMGIRNSGEISRIPYRRQGLCVKSPVQKPRKKPRKKLGFSRGFYTGFLLGKTP